MFNYDQYQKTFVWSSCGLFSSLFPTQYRDRKIWFQQFIQKLEPPDLLKVKVEESQHCLDPIVFT